MYAVARNGLTQKNTFLMSRGRLGPRRVGAKAVVLWPKTWHGASVVLNWILLRTLGAAYAETGRFSEAITQFKMSCGSPQVRPTGRWRMISGGTFELRTKCSVAERALKRHACRSVIVRLEFARTEQFYDTLAAACAECDYGALAVPT